MPSCGESGFVLVTGYGARVSYVDLDLARWRSLNDVAARRWAAQIADATGVELVEVRPGGYAGQPGQIALYRHHGALYALVPGGEVVLGYDGARFAPTPAQAADYAASWFSDTDIHAFVDSTTSPSRTVHVPTLLVAVEAAEAGAGSADLDDPRVRQAHASLQVHWESYRPPGTIIHEDWGRVEVMVDDRCQITSVRLVEYMTRDDMLAELTGRGLRLPTPDEWEYACGAGVPTLFRWGDDCPTDRYPTSRDEGPHRLPNAFGLAIGQDPYRPEETTDPAVTCGGDWGRAICGTYGYFLGWLTLASSYRDIYYDVPEGEEDSDESDGEDGGYLYRMLLRPVIQLS